jgi:uncharacterized protein with ParB-like and HNH nuclease domain
MLKKNSNMINIKELEKQISEKKNSLRTDRLDMSFGELMNLYEDGSLFITPEYQRAFRWKIEQQTKFIESILLGIPIPPIFVAEDSTKEQQIRWELVDGLQRLSTIFSFFGILKDVKEEKNNLKLIEGSIIKGLKDYTSDTFSALSKFTIKRAVCRVEIIRWDSAVDMRYELFNRLNTGGEPLSDQEIRNCVFRGIDNKLNQILRDVGNSPDFKKNIEPTEKQVETMFCEELVLRFFALKNFGLVLKTNIQEHLTEYMEKVSKSEIVFEFDKEKNKIIELITFLNTNFDYKIFRASNGIFTPALFDVIMIVLETYFDFYSKNPEKFKIKIEEFKKSDSFKEASKIYSSGRLKNRIDAALEIFKI